MRLTKIGAADFASRRFQPQRRGTSRLKKFEDKEHLLGSKLGKIRFVLSELSNVFVFDCTGWENISFEKARN